MTARMTPEMFWQRVARGDVDACWPWLGKPHSNGYGRVGGKSPYRHFAHRMAYMLTYGAIPDGMFVCHTCDNRVCCNPAHLYLGDHRQNMRDMSVRGRTRNGLEAATHCRNGHEYTPENTMSYGQCRYCRTCRRRNNREAQRRYRARTAVEQ